MQSLNEDAQKAFAEWAAAQLNAERATAQATWSNLQIAELVEKEAALASELTQRREEIATLGMQVEALQLAELGRRRLGEAVDGFVFGVKRLLGVDSLPDDDLPAVLAQLRKQIREREREMDVAEAERDRLDEVLRAQMRQGARSEGPITFLRRLFTRRADHRARLIPMKGEARNEATR